MLAGCIQDIKLFLFCFFLKESKTLFHVVGLKCAECGGYNTTRTGGKKNLKPAKNLHSNLMASLHKAVLYFAADDHCLKVFVFRRRFGPQQKVAKPLRCGREAKNFLILSYISLVIFVCHALFGQVTY